MATATATPRSDYAVRPMTRRREEGHPRLVRSAPSSNGTTSISYGSLCRDHRGAVLLRASTRPRASSSRCSAFAAGFAVRPFGALLFGRLGDLVGRKYTFLVTMMIMGVVDLPRRPPARATPRSASGAPVVLIALRLLQGLALGGEYGGAATYVAEHAPQGRRGFYTSWIQTTATLGLFLSLIVILGAAPHHVGEEDFAAWGWRIPFLLSIILLGISVWIRLQLNESPAFQKMKEEGTGSKAPLTEAFGQLDERQDRAHRPSRRHRRPGGRLVHGPVLRPVLPHPDAEDRRHDGEHPDRLLAARSARRSSSSSAGSPTRSAASRSSSAAACIAAVTYFPLFQAAHRRGQPGAGRGARPPPR